MHRKMTKDSHVGFRSVVDSTNLSPSAAVDMRML